LVSKNKKQAKCEQNLLENAQQLCKWIKFCNNIHSAKLQNWMKCKSKYFC
jgi:hypothetical protein